MKLKDVRKLGIKYCDDNNCNYAYISYTSSDEFYLTDKENANTVFFVNKNGSLDPCFSTKYAIGFHNEFKKRGNNKKKSDKRKMADMYNQDLLNYDLITNEVGD